LSHIYSVCPFWGGRYLKKEETEELLEKARIARFCCHNEDGTIHATPVWFKYEDGKIIIAIPSRSRKARNVKRNKDVTVLIDIVNPINGVMIYGTAELDDKDVLAKAISINEKYLPKERAKSYAEGSFKSGLDRIMTVTPNRKITFHF
jgi:nitroimidazol reductase NimA-like FMN-containing flavoprotein (pyridoxamine 5'-phosphate oxidase superfamily)